MANSAFTKFAKGIDSAQTAINNTQNDISNINQFQSDPFGQSATPPADGNGLPYTKVPAFVAGKIRRNIITWFVPEFGSIQMYVNPQQITYSHKKIINKERTKGGYVLQYWGEELDTLDINGTTGSSGVEGINALYEIYRAEQYAMDTIGLTLQANNATADLANNLLTGAGAALGGAVGNLLSGNNIFGTPGSTAAAAGAGILGGIFGLNSPNNNITSQNLPSLMQLAAGVEMYYGGNVYRGYFMDMTITERADNFLFDYKLTFIVTQRRGYRTNYLPFHKRPDGPTNYDDINSFNGQAITIG